MASIDAELAAYRAQLFELEQQYRGKWVVFHNGQRVDLYESFDLAANDAVSRFGRGPYLIRQIGAPPIALPVCIIQREHDEGSELRL